MTDDYMARLHAAIQEAAISADIAKGYLTAAHDEADSVEAGVKAQIGNGYALLAVALELRAVREEAS